MDDLISRKALLEAAEHNVEFQEGIVDVGELAMVAAERDRYKAERDAAVRDMKQNTKCYICKNFPKDNNISHCKHFYNCGLAYINWEWRGLEENT